MLLVLVYLANQIDHNENKYGIGFGFISNSVINFTFASHWSIKMSELRSEFHHFMVG